MKKYYSYENMNLHLCRVESSSKKTKITLPDKLVNYICSLIIPADEEVDPDKLSANFLKGKYLFEIHETTLGLLIRPKKEIKQDFEDTKALRDIYTYFHELTGLDLIECTENAYVYSYSTDTAPGLYNKLKDVDMHTTIEDHDYVLALSFRDSVLFLKNISEKSATKIRFSFYGRMRVYPSAMPTVYIANIKKKSIKEKYKLYENVPPKEFFSWESNTYCKVNKSYAFNTKTGESFMMDVRRFCYNMKMQPDNIWVTYLGKLEWIRPWNEPIYPNDK